MEHDPDIAALKKANRRPLFIAVGTVGGAVALAALWALGGKGAVRSALEAEGYTEIDVKMNGAFDYGYQAKKGTMVCGGTFTRLPFSTRREGTCFSTDPPKPPARPRHEVLADGLKRQFPSLPIAAATCPVMPPGAKEVTCTLTADAGTPVEVMLEERNGDWKIKSPQSLVARAKLSEELGKELEVKVKKPVAVDCGAGLLGYSDKDTVTCSATRTGAKKAGSVTVTFGADGSYSWKATGI